ncbi:putative RNA polymerase ECF-subfamily sigma factor [Actinoplanes missouriensis 431]|uniref:Putative RNA polymerase ECF-subfamily sigma factor n=1 Tax=Actinoplanes missouriensis (strain ATCC 14538 / DSM 43046 / CBS 188.64 / JCM 3121 / NBRC 102363 / NCIMB 12654 / NRRL B-3342 / UNCC 431) TaxID=512565 RepID=I0H767_ACTM4|nr:SigE family RNA polymerase sigma factor [Actinoplanes missouriensis]BAL88854.1 putative RNA polymerase ECF-subfamily sigma factor [Actinoplanes missouriensis 431]
MTFEDFLTARLPALLRYATVLACDTHLAEDIVQEVLARAQPRWARIAAADVPEAYVKRMIINELASWRRRRAARVVPLSHDALDAVSAPADEPQRAVGERDEMIRRIARLPLKQRIVIALRFYEGLSDQEIADLLGCRPATVRSHTSRALASMRANFPTASSAGTSRIGG